MRERARILYLYPFGGATPNESGAVMGQGILKQLINKGYKVFVIPRNKAEHELASEYGLISLFPHGENIINRTLSRYLYIRIGSNLARELANLVKQHDINIILERHRISGIGELTARLASIPYVTNDVLGQPDLKYYGGVVTKIQSILLPKHYLKYLEKNTFHFADAIISHSISYSEILAREYGVGATKIFQFYAMVDKNFFRPGSKIEACKEIGANPETFNILYAGTFDRLHTPEYLLPVIKKLSGLDIQFIMVGDGPLLETFKRELESQYNSRKVVFVDRVINKKVRSYILASDICIESIWNKKVAKYAADSTKIYEYMACGKAVVVSDLPGQIQEIRKQNAGILVNPSSTKAFTDAIITLFNDQELRELMGINGRLLVEQTWNWDYTGEVIDKSIQYALRRIKQNSVE